MGQSKKMAALAASHLTVLAASVSGAPVLADDAIVIEGNVALVSDYRFRGVSLSDRNVAIQGGFDASFNNGFSLGTWASSIEPVGGAEIEVDAYGGFDWQAGPVDLGVGAIGYFYPGGGDADYGEIFGAISGTAGLFDLGAGVNYAPEQDNIGNDDNIYVFGNASVPLGDSPYAVSGTLGFEDGAFANDKVDWSLGVGRSAFGLDWMLQYVDTDQDFDAADATAVLSVSQSLGGN